MPIKILVLSVSAFLFTTGSLFSQAEHPQLYFDYLSINGNSKKIAQSKIKKAIEIVKNGQTTDTASISYYDQSGMLTKLMQATTDTTRKDNKNYFTVLVYVYKEGKLVERVDSTYTDVRRMVIYYDDAGNISKEEEYLGKSKLIIERNHEYDDLQRLVESDEIYYGMNCKSNTKYSYDSYNNIARIVVKDLCKDPDGRTRETKISNKYDKNYDIIEKHIVYPSGAYRTETRKYDAKGNVINGYEITSKNDYSEYTITYDKSFNKTKIDRTDVTGDLKTKFTEIFKYDNAGNLTEDLMLGPGGETMSLRKILYETY